MHTGSASANDLESLAEGIGRQWHLLADLWDLALAEQLVETIDQGLEQAEGDLITRLGDLAAYLATFAETGREPNTAQRIRLAELVEALSRPLPEAMPAAKTISVEPMVLAKAPRSGRARVARNTIRLLGVPDALCPGLVARLGERHYEIHAFPTRGLREFMAGTIPGALLVTANDLRNIPALSTLWRDAGAPPCLIAVSTARDLTHRLLAMRMGCAAYFPGPLDAYQIVARIDELLGRQELPPYRVLVVEDDRELAVQCGHWIAGEGMTARIAGYGSAAIEAITEFQPDLVLIDATLPDARGIDLVQVIRQQPEQASLPIVLLTTIGDAAERFDAIAAGADEVLVKPLKPRHVIGVIRSRVQRAHWLRSQTEASQARDPKTGFFPRGVVLDRIGPRLGTRGSVLMMVGWDDAEQVRRALGSTGLAAADVDMGQRLSGLLAPHDLTCSLRDGFWLVLVTRERQDAIEQLAERVRFAIAEKPFASHGGPLPVRASVAIVEIEDPGIDTEAAIQSAESGIELAQHRGGDQVYWADGNNNVPTDPSLAVRAVLTRGLDARHCRAEYRPMVPLKGNLHGQFEFEYYLISANDVRARAGYLLCTQIASEVGVRAAFERARLAQAMSVRQEARNERQSLRLTLPMLADWLLEPGELDWLMGQFEERKLSGSGFTFEFPGSELLDHRDALTAAFTRLRALGVRIGVLDFGRDFAAIHILASLTVDSVRLDADLVDACASSNSVNPTLQTLVRKAHQLGATVIAPGMNTPERAHVLLRLGVDYGIGDAFGPATAGPDFDFNRPLW
ncbi:MAG: EAL domain-containing protein [Ahniella sp.]|nr:EAL domain-containing protein [Ahniella sp.]